MTADLVAGRPGPSVHFRNSYYATGRLRVRHAATLRLRRVHRFQFQLEVPPGDPRSVGTPTAAAREPVHVRAVLPGCLTTPSEVTLDPARGDTATVYVTPLAEGPLPGAHLELNRVGAQPQRLPLALRGVNGAVSARLVWAALLVPAAWLLLTASSGGATPAGSAAADGPLAAAALRHGPQAAALATGLQHGLDALARIERAVPVGFCLAVVLWGGALLSVLAHR